MQAKPQGCAERNKHIFGVLSDSDTISCKLESFHIWTASLSIVESLGTTHPTDMRLLCSSTLKFKEFLNPPPYAILSHRWGTDEVTFEDLASGKELSGQGYEKILRCCKFARARGHDYVWIDTCCIDKRSSAELSESINSMWEWYAKAKECYAYLTDVMSSHLSNPLNAAPKRPSEWFSRGWTLQELLAPRNVVFLDHHWRIIGFKTDIHILEEVSLITSVPIACLESPFLLQTACVAQKLSWASRRVTSRREDIAYCLLGLVGINMPLLYGEGDKAFLRLQHEIIRQTDDESVFAWRQPYTPKDYMSGLLASSVHHFYHSGDVRRLDLERNPYAITNKGLDLTIFSFWDTESDTHIIPLNCQYGGNTSARPTQQCAIAVKRERNLYSRVDVQGLGYHLHLKYPQCMADGLKSCRLRIRLSRWQSEYEKAGVIIKSFIERAQASRDRRAVLAASANALSLDKTERLWDNQIPGFWLQTVTSPRPADADVLNIMDCCYSSALSRQAKEVQYALLGMDEQEERKTTKSLMVRPEAKRSAVKSSRALFAAVASERQHKRHR